MSADEVRRREEEEGVVGGTVEGPLRPEDKIGSAIGASATTSGTRKRAAQRALWRGRWHFVFLSWVLLPHPPAGAHTEVPRVAKLWVHGGVSWVIGRGVASRRAEKVPQRTDRMADAQMGWA